ncbi:MAG TPA: flagellar export protein FliJ [Nevskiaceae bacterium]|nr:flagellar export protein FliJ [Nevskiaceae bacterium]
MDEQRLQPLLALAGRRVDTAAGGVQRQRAESQTQQARLDELRDYLAEYENRAAQSSCWQLMNHAAFVARLRDAIKQQTRTVDQAQKAVDVAVADWTTQRLNQRRFEVLRDQAHGTRVAEQQRQEQRELDELASHTPRPKP